MAARLIGEGIGPGADRHPVLLESAFRFQRGEPVRKRSSLPLRKRAEGVAASALLLPGTLLPGSAYFNFML
jgi:hypothetical protein